MAAVKVPGPLRTILALLALLAISIGLAVLNSWLGLDHFVAFNSPTIRNLWLPLLFLLLCLNAWLIGELWRLWAAEGDSSDFYEIDRAWSEARLAMQRSRGRAEGPAGLPGAGRSGGWRSRLVPRVRSGAGRLGRPAPPDAPIHVFATYEAIFVTCPGLSALGHLVASRTGASETSATSPDAPSPHPATEESPPEAGTSSRSRPESHRPTAAGTQIAATTVVEAEPARVAVGSPAQRTAKKRSIDILLSQTAEVEMLTRKLKYLCKSMLRDRRPYCPINGILLAIPYPRRIPRPRLARPGQPAISI